jgi:hypothetical protein
MQRVAERGGNIGSLTTRLHQLLDAHGAVALERAVAGALAQGMPHLGAIRQLLDLYRHERNLPPPISNHLPSDPRVRELHVRPHSLNDYDQLTEDDDDQDTTQ